MHSLHNQHIKEYPKFCYFKGYRSCRYYFNFNFVYKIKNRQLNDKFDKKKKQLNDKMCKFKTIQMIKFLNHRNQAIHKPKATHQHNTELTE